MGVAALYDTFTPYPHTALSEMDYAQTADVLYTVHLDYPVYRATRTAHTAWTYEPVAFAPTVAVPAVPTIAVNQPNTTGLMPTDYAYVITAVGGNPEQESRPSAAVTVSNDLTLNGNTNVLTLPAKPAGVERYIIYKKMAGSFGYIGQTEDATFTDGTPQIQPVLSDSPPIGTNPFDAANSYPSTATFHDQRLVLGRTRSLPNAVWGSHPSDFENMDLSRPSKPDDAYSFALVAERVNSVTQMASLDDLIVLSSDGIFAVNGGADGQPMTPAEIVPKRQNSKGSGRLNPILIDSNLFYVPNKGASVRALGFKFEIDGYDSNNVTIFSPHFFKGSSIVDWAYIEEPYSAIFTVRDDGVLLCFTWEAEQQVWGWTQMEIDGSVLSVGAITEGGFDRLYACIERVINGVTRRFHERLALPHVDDVAVACHLDCSVTQVYDPPRNVISGLWHLEGETVSAYYDGYVAKDLVVTNGKITLPNGYEATIATVGLPFSGEIETLPLVLNSQSGSQHTNEQNIAKVVIRALDTRGLTAGITGTELEAITERMGGEDGMADIDQRDYDVTPQGHWEPSTTLTIRQDQPLPAHITGIFVEPRVSKK
jgi:hypothetical protein